MEMKLSVHWKTMCFQKSVICRLLISLPKTIKEILLGLENEGKAETAHRMHQRIPVFFPYAVMGMDGPNPTADLHKLFGSVKSKPMKALPSMNCRDI
ncbi:MAG: hypothetical protein CM15mP66_04440 [Pseudomonadota bacterium]|nr:MAG: hypothetical protein CM15mP66_04440 [Pseudomonadota bacterium]